MSVLVDMNGDPVAGTSSTRRKMPKQKPATSEQSVQTPKDFIDAVTKRFGEIHVDLAADEQNKQAPFFYSEKDDAFSRPVGEWAERIDAGVGYLNPPFGEIAKWAERCAEEMSCLDPHGRILLLTPASTDAEWYWKHVAPHAYSLMLSPRLTFVGHEHAYPKGLMLSVYESAFAGEFAVEGPCIRRWRWQ